MGEHELAFPCPRLFLCLQPRKTHSNVPYSGKKIPAPNLFPLLNSCGPLWLCHSSGICYPIFYVSFMSSLKREAVFSFL